MQYTRACELPTLRTPQPNHLVLPWTAANDRAVAAHSNQKVQRQQQAGHRLPTPKTYTHTYTCTYT